MHEFLQTEIKNQLCDLETKLHKEELSEVSQFSASWCLESVSSPITPGAQEGRIIPSSPCYPVVIKEMRVSLFSCCHLFTFTAT